MYISAPPTMTPDSFDACPSRNSGGSCGNNMNAAQNIAVMTPMNMPMPPKRGMGFVCILRSSRGVSIAPILGARRIAKGVNSAASANEVRNDMNMTN
jgi:hypothetical protein